jgi:hypothetical protein
VGARELGQLVDRLMRERGWSQSLLAYKLSDPPHHIYNETQVRRIRLGQRHVDHVLVQRIIDVFELDQDDALDVWHTAGLWPPELTVDGLRRLRVEAVVTASSGVRTAQSGTQRKGSHTRGHLRLVTIAA